MKDWLFHPVRLLDIGIIALIVGFAVWLRVDFSEWQAVVLFMPAGIVTAVIRCVAASDLKR
jgi:hypothetical protein